ncbi:MAG: hypothetical protein CMG71_08260 [Candidatus Marinimicrobia bacterium]|nr:hypothetical protein [Candidatus Neomarinimicrobiota bacterium]|tara:strand:+ start:214 stop:1041 length:828 start_codon:yes stop_codon:yes gene_type:complete
MAAQNQANPQNIKAALEVFWRSSAKQKQIPDYGGFTEWFDDVWTCDLHKGFLTITTEKYRVPDHRVDDGKLALELIDIADHTGVLILGAKVETDPKRFGKWKGPGSPLKRLNKAKLILYLLNQVFDKRGLEILSFIKKYRNGGFPDEPGEDASGVELRHALQNAVNRADSRLSYKLLGRLRPEDHDPGEIAYLESTVEFHSGRFQDCIKYAQRISRDDIEGPAAVLLIIESYARLGELDSVIKEISTNSGVLFPIGFKTYVRQTDDRQGENDNTT